MIGICIQVPREVFVLPPTMTSAELLLYLAQVLLLIFIILFKLVLLIPLLVKWNSPFSEIPGPLVASWTRLWLVQSLVLGKAPADFVKLSQQHGKSLLR